jgi:NAD(P)-dependent dehydrogenase (short-subunit alcohol dehydrogenase family)
VLDRLPEFDLTGATAIVTGGSRSIGRGAAIALAEAGANVVVSGRQEGDLKSVVSEIEAFGGTALPVACDVRNEGDVGDLIATTVASFGALNIMVANAGIFQKWASAEEGTLAEWDDIYATNLRGAMLSCMAAGRQMLQQATGGSIVTISSIQGMVGIEGTMSYTASKHGVIGMTKALALDWASYGIRVNAIAPAFIARDEEPLQRDATAIEFVTRNTPMARWGTTRESALAVLFLASPASSYITGAVLAVDGGWTAR